MSKTFYSYSCCRGMIVDSVTLVTQWECLPFQGCSWGKHVHTRGMQCEDHLYVVHTLDLEGSVAQIRWDGKAWDTGIEDDGLSLCGREL